MKRVAFTLIELLTCLTVVAVVAGISFPVFSSAKKSALERQSISDMKQIALAAILYREDWKKTEYGDMVSMGLPAEYATLFGANPRTQTGYPLPPIRSQKYPVYYYMPLSAEIDGRDTTWKEAALRDQDRTVLVCDPWFEGFGQVLANAYDFQSPNRLNGVTLGGQAIKKKAYGEWFEFDRWKENDENRQP